MSEKQSHLFVRVKAQNTIIYMYMAALSHKLLADRVKMAKRRLEIYFLPGSGEI